MASRLIAEPLYHPSGGINLDANGLVARPDECIDGLNIDIDTDRVVQRGGTKAFPVPTEIGPVLKFHRYIHPTRGALLFAFTANNVYQYQDIYGWTSVLAASINTVDSWSVTDVVDRELGSTVIAAGCTYTRPTEGYQDALGRELLIYDNQEGFVYHGLGIVNNAGGYIFPDYWGVDVLQFEIEFSIDDAGSDETGWLLNVYDSGIPSICGVKLQSKTNKTLRLYIDGDYHELTFDNYNQRYSARIELDTGKVYFNGIVVDTLTPVVPDTQYHFLLHQISVAQLIDVGFIYKFIMDDDIFIAHPDEYFYKQGDFAGTRVFNQYNSIFIDTVSGVYKWTLSDNGTNEYYLELDAGGDPGLPSRPETVRARRNDANARTFSTSSDDFTYQAGNVGSLAAKEWDWGDNETTPLGYNTIYVRMELDEDPNDSGVYRLGGIRALDTDIVAAYNDYSANKATSESVDVGFIDLDLKKNLYDDEAYGTAISAATPPTTQAWPLTVGGTPTPRTIVAGTAYLVVDTGSSLGVIATASLAEYRLDASPSLERINRWLPVDEDEIAFSDNSYIDLETGAISVEFLKNTYDTQTLHIYYQYEDDVLYRPIHVANFHNALILSNTVEQYTTDTSGPVTEWRYTPWRVRWSEQDNIRLFKERNYQDIALDDITPILGMRSLETAASSTIIGPLYFLKHNSIVRGTYNQAYNIDPNVPAPFFNFEIASSEGLESTNTAIAVDGTMFYLGRNDVYAFNGYERVSLTKDYENRNTRIQRTLIDALNINYQYRNFGLYDEINRKYYLFVVLNTSDSNYPEDCFVYDIDRRYWVRYTYSQVSAAIDTEVAFEGTIDGLVGTIDGLGAVAINDLTNNASKSLLFSIGDITYYGTNSNIDEEGVNNVDIESYFITRDFLARTLENEDRVQRVVFEAKDGELTIAHNSQYSTDTGDFTNEQTLTFGNKYITQAYNPDVVAHATRFW
jgi:hypothetical protein